MERLPIVSRVYDLLPSRVQASRTAMALVIVLLIASITFSVLAFVYGYEPDDFNVVTVATEHAEKVNHKPVTGYVTTYTLMELTHVLLYKPGGYQSNDLLLPSTAWADNIPNWEYGALVQIRDAAHALRNEFSRSQSQSVEDEDMAEASPLFNYQNDSWMFPATEKQYEKALMHLSSYLDKLADPTEQHAQFYARADNLEGWLSTVSKRLGSLSQRLSASVGQCRINTDLAGDAEATQSTSTPREICVKPSSWDIDDVFFEARGTCWALLHLFRSIDHDFKPVLQKKNARPSLHQIIRELENTQQSVWSPLILNGSGFGVFNNHSLVLGNHIARANAAIIDLQNLLKDG